MAKRKPKYTPEQVQNYKDRQAQRGANFAPGTYDAIKFQQNYDAIPEQVFDDAFKGGPGSNPKAEADLFNAIIKALS